MEPEQLTQEPIEIERARSVVLGRVVELGAEAVGLGDALGRVLAGDAVATDPVPGFDNSAMDGFAVRAADTRGARPDAPVALGIVGEARAGHPAAVRLGPGEAIAISTGAMVPDGADAVIRVEETAVEGGEALALARVGPGDEIRRAGEDLAAGETAIAAGTRLGPAQLGVLASIGAGRPLCRRRPRVSVLTSGDELLGVEEPMRSGAVRESNSHSISALARSAGADVVSTGTAADTAAATRDALGPALEADVAVVCGGVSVGEHDHVKAALAELGVEQRFWRVALKPGKPTWFGDIDRGDGGDGNRPRRTLVFGLPGNPVSAMVTFILLVGPALSALQGADPGARRARARLGRDCDKRPGRAHALRCRLEAGERGWVAWPAERQGSHVLTSMLDADCLAILPTSSGPARAGDPVEIEMIGPVAGR